MLELVHPVTGEISASPPLSLDLAPDLPFDEWCEMGRKLCAGGKVINWWIGDWWAYGRKYGEGAKAAAEGIFGRAYQTLVNCGNVAQAFGSNRRRLDLSWSHHAEVAALPSIEADGLLDEAEAQGWSKQRQREQLNTTVGNIVKLVDLKEAGLVKVFHPKQADFWPEAAE